MNVFMILFVSFYIASNPLATQIVYFNKSFVDILNERDGSFQKPFNHIKDIFLLQTNEFLQIQMLSNMSCNEKISNIANMSFM